MSLIEILSFINTEIFAVPSVVLFFGVGVFLTLKTRFVQIRKMPKFFSLMFGGVRRQKYLKDQENMSSFNALFTAMAGTIGMGNMVSPSLAIFVGGPGALFWLLFYMIFGAVTKYVEVCYALTTREYLADGFIMGGPMQYLKKVSPWLASWYSYIIIIVILGWTSGQSNTLANIMYLEGVPHWAVGLFLSLFVVIALQGGAKRVGALASKMVPVMFVLYMAFSLSILLKNPAALMSAFKQMMGSVLSPAAAVGGFFGASIFQAIQSGMFRGIFITEAGLGTSSIPHALADTKKYTDQAILAMGSMIADALLSAVSGFLVLVTGVWSIGTFRSTLIYEVFKINAPGIGQYVLLLSVTLFVLTTVMGNSFSGSQSLGTLTKDNTLLMRLYIVVTALVTFAGALVPMPLIWQIMDILIMLVAIPNLIGLIVLTFKRPDDIKV